MNDSGNADLLRATIFHTPSNPLSSSSHDGSSLVCYEDGGLLVRGGRVVACGEYEVVRRKGEGARTTDWRGGFLLPGLVDTHVHYPQLRIIGSLGRSLLDWLEHVALPEEARMADARYAAEVAREFTRALASHGTTTALVFGAHFAGATAALFDAAALSGLRVISGLVLSDRRGLSRQRAVDSAVSQARPVALRRDAAVRRFDYRVDARGLPDPARRTSRPETADPHQRKHQGSERAHPAVSVGP
jgi:cytosine/adenosine deaminase-related metal-dependent hydrolase